MTGDADLVRGGLRSLEDDGGKHGTLTILRVLPRDVRDRIADLVSDRPVGLVGEDLQELLPNDECLFRGKRKEDFDIIGFLRLACSGCDSSEDDRSEGARLEADKGQI